MWCVLFAVWAQRYQWRDLGTAVFTQRPPALPYASPLPPQLVDAKQGPSLGCCWLTAGFGMFEGHRRMPFVSCGAPFGAVRRPIHTMPPHSLLTVFIRRRAAGSSSSRTASEWQELETVLARLTHALALRLDPYFYKSKDVDSKHHISFEPKVCLVRWLTH